MSVLGVHQQFSADDVSITLAVDGHVARRSGADLYMVDVRCRIPRVALRAHTQYTDGLMHLRRPYHSRRPRTDCGDPRIGLKRIRFSMSNNHPVAVLDTRVSETSQHPKDSPSSRLGSKPSRGVTRFSDFTLALILARRLRVRRVELGLTRERLALRAGVPPSTIKAFERSGRIGLEAFMRLATALGRLHDLSDVLLRRRTPDSSRVLGRRIRGRTRGRASTEEPLNPRSRPSVSN